MKKQTAAPNDNEINKARRIGELKGLILVVLGLFLLAAYAGFSTGSAGVLAGDILRYGFGLGALLIPVSFVLLGISFFRSTKNPLWSWGFAAGTIFFLCLLGFLHHIFIPAGEELAPASLPEGGGLTGALVASGLHKVLGTTGAVLVLIMGMLASLIVTGKLSLSALTEKAEDKLQNVRDIRKEQDAETGFFDGETDEGSGLSESGSDRSGPSLPFLGRHKEDPGAGGILDVYQDKEFAAYNEGVRKESPFKKMLNFGQTPQDAVSARQDASEADDDITAVAEQMGNHAAKTGERPGLTRVYPEKQEKVIMRPSTDAEGLAPEPAPWEREAFIPATDDGDDETGGIRQGNRSTEREATDGGAGTAASSEEKGTRFILTPHGMSAVKVKTAIDGNPETTPASAEKADGNAEQVPPGQLKPKCAYIFPPLTLLNEVQKSTRNRFDADVREQCRILEKTLADFRVNAKVIGVTRGPSVTRFELEPAPGVKVSSVVNLADDIALRLAAPGVRVEAPIPGKAAIGIEAPNVRNEMVGFKEVVDSPAVRKDESKLCIGLGKDISGKVITIDLSKMPHLLVAGSTGSGKSVCINTLLAGILYKARPDEVKLILVDPKVVELTNYNGIPHLLVPVVTDAKKAASALHWAVAEMERRYQSFADNRVRDIRAYNEQTADKMPFIVIVIDEMSDLMMVAKADVEDAILRLAQKARACGIHLVLATQRPSVDVITGIVKANIPSRIAFAVSSQTDSRTILDLGGAEKLLGKGDMLFYPIGANKPLRVQGAFVSDAELNRVTDFVKEQGIPVEYSEEVTSVALPSDSQKEDRPQGAEGEAAAGEAETDELLDEAIRLVLDLGQASSSMLQRRFRIGYNRAARLVDAMEELGIVGPAVGSKPRELKMSRREVERLFLHLPGEE